MATKEAQRQFIERVGALAAADMRASGVLASLTIAQAILESGWGTSELSTKANALFGIKADGRWPGRVYSKETKECYDGVSYTTVTALFRAYGSWEESVNDHSDFLVGSARYAAVIGERDYREAAEAIKAAGYATAPDYAEKLVSLIERYELTAYDGTLSKEDHAMRLYLSPSNQPHNVYTGVSTTEKAEMEAVAKKVKTILDGQYEVETVMANLNLGISYGERPTECKNKGCDFYLAIHSNAGGAGAAAGAVGFYHPNGKNAKALATALVKELDFICPVKSNRSSSVVNGMNAFNGQGYGEIRSPMQLGVPSALIEVNFHDNSTVAKWIVNNKDAIAAAMVKAIVETFGIKKKSSPGGAAPEQSEEKPSGGLYYVQAGAFRERTNALAHAAKLKAAGFDAILKTADGLYKVQTGAYSVKANAEAQVSKLKAAGFDAFATVNGGSIAASPAPPAKIAQVGSTVRLKSGAKTYTGGSLAGFVYERDHIISELKGDRAVITYGGVTVAAVHVSDLILK
ncbi:glucosaminidase domain-containing protein [Clostridium sp. D33t1_170424_F3]|uniref:glucosaminidase domain-containing protein n=1 Tax=Clostridium sp. D33t1_170424_F3 TaxID=2787099 RepID=UPI0018AA7209|nr:glucosaminidase domain-containing protein [Clostridium sp. D33t1_170424_F3]